jgi:predicted O-methyltransferase YrrM
MLGSAIFRSSHPNSYIPKEKPMLKTDPFLIKRYPKWHPQRLAYTASIRLMEQAARNDFQKYALPEKLLKDLPATVDAKYTDTAVTPLQMQYLLATLSTTEHLQDTVVAEIGSYRGITTQVLAKATARKLISIDPYIGYGGSEADYQTFKDNTSDLQNVIHKRMTSGEASRSWDHELISFIFIDAVHDYANTAFDIMTWSSKVTKGGIIACHDTDEHGFAGTRKVTYELSQQMELFAHIDNLSIFINT